MKVNFENLWMQELREALKTADQVAEFFGMASFSWPKHYPLFIPRLLAEEIRRHGKDSPLWRQFIPDQLELSSDEGYTDPIGDLTHQKTPYLIHRYPSRALFLTTPRCPVICRYCFRKNELPNKHYHEDINTTWNYLETHPEIEEIIFSGGDPFLLSNRRLEEILEKLTTISSLRYIRFHTRTPIVLPSRFTSELNGLLNKYRSHFHQMMVAIHVNHIHELYPAVQESLRRLEQESGVTLLAQTVLLKEVNDDEEELVTLFKQLLALKIRPYYLHHPDQVRGGLHFSLPLSKGRRLYQQLRKRLPGWAIPRYMIDLPGGEGKIEAFNPEDLTFNGYFLNFHGKKIFYQEKGIDISPKVS